jgi:hypothetical protein
MSGRWERGWFPTAAGNPRAPLLRERKRGEEKMKGELGCGAEFGGEGLAVTAFLFTGCYHGSLLPL